jgi:dipeptidyl aminopeptidase/acylaminoacyl peptidase
VPEGLNSTAGLPTSFSPSGDRLIVSHQSATMPGDLWVYDLSASQATQLSRSAIASIASAALPASRIVHYKSFDGATISALLWVPFNLDRNGKNPGIVLPHGGPTGQTLDTFSRNVIALVSRGYTVIAPNVRGSTGYGMTFQHMNYQDLGGGDLQDEVYAAKFLAATGYVDAKRIGITGGSYGGYMTMAGLTEYPDLFAAGVDLFGIVNFITFFQHTQPWMAAISKVEYGDPDTQKEMLDKLSPIYKLDRIKAATMVQHGANDTNVPVIEAEQIVKTLKDRGVPVEYILFPDEGHGWRKVPNRIKSTVEMVRFFSEHLQQD